MSCVEMQCIGLILTRVCVCVKKTVLLVVSQQACYLSPVQGAILPASLSVPWDGHMGPRIPEFQSLEGV